jgi:pimeloyl-ACP methyl ester carboxylesterase
VFEVAAQRRPGPFLLIGHSMGVAICIEVAARGSDRVERLILVDIAGMLLAKARETSLLNSEWFRRYLLANDLSRIAGAALLTHDFSAALARV